MGMLLDMTGPLFQLDLPLSLEASGYWLVGPGNYKVGCGTSKVPRDSAGSLVSGDWVPEGL